MTPRPALEFLGNERFEVRARIGQGAVGVVYDAFDRERSTRVAVKTLRAMDAATLMSLKNEFRAVQDLQHPNLVSLGELFEAGGTWFFTMEFVQGTHFVRYVRPDDPNAVSSVPPPGPGSPSTAPAGGGFDEERLRGALAQLVRGLGALHEAGKLHRDVKPSNVLVADDGRVVILDFGVARDLALQGGDADDSMVGTAAYMAPEQALGDEVGPAADWYGVGVVLYQSLTGRLPFAGSLQDMLAQKLVAEAPPPRALAPHVPADLDALCTELLRMDPGARPTREEILRRLGSSDGMRSVTLARQPAIFIGRRRELGALEEAYDATRERRAVTVCVHGESGVGKSFLVRRFIDDVRAHDERALVLAGRCYERESVPYKAVDGVIDRLSRLLASLEPAEAEDLLRGDLPLLARAFPVLGQVPHALAPEALDLVNPHELRARVFTASRALFTRVASRGPLIVVIDDLQWADLDSLSLLAEIMRPPDAPPMLLVATMRGSSDRGSDAGAQLAARIGGDVRHVHVEQLRRKEARELAVQLLGAEGGSEREIDAIVEDAKGHPLFIDELVRQRGSRGGAQVLKLDDALWARVTRLEPAARELLEAIAIAGVPIAQEIVADAAGLDLGRLFLLGSMLRAANFAKTGGPRKGDLIEAYHDRIRESVLAHLDERTRSEWHRRLATALERAATPDPEALATHWEGAGDRAKAADHAERAASDAARGLAFDRAARLYRRCLDLRGSTRDPHDVKRRLADALTDGGYVAQAAEVQLDLARDARGDEAIDLRRMAAEHLLCSGHFDRGLVLLRSVLAEVGVYLPRSPLAVIVALLGARLVLWLRGVSFRERSPDAADSHALVRIDAVWSAGAGFSMSDNIRGAYFQTRNLLLALQVGDPRRVVRALAMEVAFRSAGGAATRLETRRLLDRERALERRLGTPEARAMTDGAEGWAHYMVGEWPQARRFLTASEELFRDRCVGVAFLLNSTRLMLYRTLGYLGDLHELAARVTPAFRQVVEQEDHHAVIHLQTGPMALLGLAADEPDRVVAMLEEASAHLPRGAFLMQHYFSLLGHCQLDLYRGDDVAAHDRMTRAWPALKRSLLLRLQPVRILALEQRARCAIAAAMTLDGGPREALLRAAERDERRLARDRLPWSHASSTLMGASIAMARGRPEVATREFRAAAERFRALEMPLYAAAAQRRQGEIVGGEEGAALVRAADELLAVRGVRHATRMTNTLVPRV